MKSTLDIPGKDGGHTLSWEYRYIGDLGEKIMAIAPKLHLPLNILPLENGDRLTRSEFERRYTAMSQVKKAELIEGIVYMGSPVRAKSHGRPHMVINHWLGAYMVETPGVEALDNTTVRLDRDNEPQPDCLLRIEVGGQSRISQDDYVEGAPELVAEVAASSAAYDLNQKLNVYRRNQVQEYLVWRVYDTEFDWFYLDHGAYIQLEPNGDGITCSRIFPGLWLDKAALMSGNLTQVMLILQRGLASIEHQTFVQRLGSLTNQ
jgi:Uma2 family endonuclease